MTSKIQTRAVCAICLKDHAVINERMVDHCYMARRGGGINNSCKGYGEVHYGHKDAPELLRSHITNMENDLAEKSTTLSLLKNKIEHLNTVVESESEDSSLAKYELGGAKYQCHNLEFMIETNLPREIKKFKTRINNWTLCKTYNVDLDG